MRALLVEGEWGVRGKAGGIWARLVKSVSAVLGNEIIILSHL